MGQCLFACYLYTVTFILHITLMQFNTLIKETQPWWFLL